MERRPPSTRPRIPGGYGNYPGRDPESPPPQQGGRRKRNPAPWGGLFEGQAQTPLPTAAWEAGDRGDQEWYRGGDGQSSQGAATGAAAGRPAPGTGDVGGIAGLYGTGTQGLAAAGGYVQAPRGSAGRRKSPLVADAPRLTVLPPLVRPGDPPRKTDEAVEGESEGVKKESTSEGRGGRGRKTEQGERAPLQQSTSTASSSWRGRSSSRNIGWLSTGGGGDGEGYGSPNSSIASSSYGSRSRRNMMQMPATTAPSTRQRDNIFSGRARTAGSIGRRNRSGFGASGAPSPFLTARSASSGYSGGGSTWRSPLEQSAVNPFSASFGVETYAEQQQEFGGSRVEWFGGKRGRGGSTAEPGQPLLRGSGGTGGGYGSRWSGRINSADMSRANSGSKRPKSTGHKVDEQGLQIFFKHGVRLVEAAEIRLDTLTGPTTYCVFLLPYLLLALALWLDLGNLDVLSYPFTPSDNACDITGVCHFRITGAPTYNSFLNLNADFELIDGLVPGPSPASVQPDPVNTGATAGPNTNAAEGSGSGGERLRARTRSLLSSVRADAGVFEAGDVFIKGEGDAIFGRADDPPGDALVLEADVEREGWWGGARTSRNLSLGLGRRKRRGEDSDKVHLYVGIGLQIRGSTGVDVNGRQGPWETLFDCDAKENVQVVTCYYSDRYCETATLGRVLFDSPGVLGRFPDYAVQATLKLIRHGQPVEGAGGRLAQSATFAVLTENPAYLLATAITRLPLLAITAFLLLYWMTRGCGGAGGERDPAPSAIVPERRYITLLLAGLLLWQNPMLAADEWMDGLGFDDRLRWARFTRDVCQYAGMQIVWLCWVCLMDCQHFVKSRRIVEPAFEGDWDAYRQVHGDDDDSQATDGDDMTASTRFLKDDYPPHHPKSESFPDFIVPKFLYGLASLGVGTCLAILRHPAIANLDQKDAWQGRLELAYAVLAAASGLFMFGWAMYFARVAISSGRVLRGQPFMATRRQQLSYRVMLMQGFIVATLLAWSVGLHVTHIVQHLIRQQTVSGAASDFTVETLTSDAADLSTWAGGIREPLGKLILISAVCYNLAYVFLPPAHSVKRRFDRMYINMEKDMPPREVVRRYKDSKELQPLFCLETSCLLVEVAWQAYYDPHRVNLADFVAPGKQELGYLGLSLVAFFEDEETETRAVLCRGTDRLVLAFRGTARFHNVLTDLKIHQVPLPQLLPAGRDPIVIKQPDGSSGERNSLRYSYSNKNGNMINPSGSSEVGNNTNTNNASTSSFVRRPRSRSRSEASPTNSLRRARSPPFQAALARPSSSRRSPPCGLSTATAASPTKAVAGKAGYAEELSPPSESEDGEYASPVEGRNGGEVAVDGGTLRAAELDSKATVSSPTNDEEKGGEGDDNSDGVDAADSGNGGNGIAVSESESAAAAAMNSILFPSGYGELKKLTSKSMSKSAVETSPSVEQPHPESGNLSDDVEDSSNLNVRADESSATNGGGHDTPVVEGRPFSGASGAKAGTVGGPPGAAGLQWEHSPRDGGPVFGDVKDSRRYARNLRERTDFSDDAYGVDFELDADGGGRVHEGDFHIDPRGDGSFTTTAARCFKAVIHRIPVARQALPRVHGGFWEVYSKLREKVLAALAVEMQNDYRPLYITGHSLGGALASLAAYDIDKNFELPDTMTLYTFGSPRVGNGVFARKMTKKVKHHFRVVNDGDMVTGLPQFFGTYDHAGVKVVVDSGKYGNFIVAPTMVEETFGAKSLTSVAPHFLAQYRECLEACMEEADLEDYVSRGVGLAAGRDSKVDPDRVPDWLKGKRRKDKQEDSALL